MALATYDDLKTEIADNVARSDVTSASAVVDTFIDLAEAYINRKLRIRKMMDDTTITMTASTNVASLPADWLQTIVLEYPSAPKNIDYISRSAFPKIVAAEGSGKPSVYTLVHDKTTARDQIRLAPTPDSAYTLDLTYYAKIPALSAQQTTSWLLTYYPEIYVNAALYYAFKRYRSPLAADYKALLDADIQTLTAEDEVSDTGGGAGRIRVNATIV